MLLYLLRHADAEPCASSDAQRKLTAKGIQQAGGVGRFCNNHELVPAHILTSPYERAKHTALLFAQELDCQTDLPEVEIAPFLACGMRPETALSELRSHSKIDSIMLVGHEPDLSHLAAYLLGATSDSIHIRKASLTLIELSAFRSEAGILHFSIPVKLMH